jgi:hypothetical protein
MQLLPKFYDWLSGADALQASNVIFVPAGREYRKQIGLQLFHEGWASTLLLSVGRFELRNFTQYALREVLSRGALPPTEGRRPHIRPGLPAQVGAQQ